MLYHGLSFENNVESTSISDQVLRFDPEMSLTVLDLSDPWITRIPNTPLHLNMVGCVLLSHLYHLSRYTVDGSSLKIKHCATFSPSCTIVRG